MAPADRFDGSAPSRRQMWGALDHGSVMTVEVLAGVLLWGGIGWLTDAWLGTGPWLGAIGVFVGFGAGLYLVVLRANRMDAEDSDRVSRLVDSDRVSRLVDSDRVSRLVDKSQRDKDTSGPIGGDAARLAR
jgi:F0F1-type ATP synthase assembly protein I